MQDIELILCSPRPAGTSASEAYFAYKVGHPGRFTPVELNEVPQVGSIDEAGAKRLFARQNGWLVEFRPIFGRHEKWAVFACGEKLYVDMRGSVYCLSDGDIGVSVRPAICFACISLERHGKCERALVRYPTLRELFLDGQVPAIEIDPFCHIFSEIKSDVGRKVWTQRWTTGLAVPNVSFRPI